MALWAGACADASGQGDVDLKPQIIGLSKAAVSVGQSVTILGANFAHGRTGHTVVLFEGEYHAKSGATNPVSYEVRPHWEDGNSLVWSHVGPYNVPFSPTGDEIGTFIGTATIINIGPKGEEYFSEPATVELEILPSIILTGLAPVESDCDQPSKVILDNFPYKVDVKAIGFEPRNFTYVVDSPFQTVPKVMRQEAVAAVDSFGQGGEIVFPEVPEDRPFYNGVLVVAALDQNGKEQAIAITVGVHRPFEFILSDKVEPAEVEAAQPVSGCFDGGNEDGRFLTYTETQVDTRSRTTGITWNEEWLESHTGTIEQSKSTTNSVGITISNSSETGSEANWERGHDFGGSVKGEGMLGLVKVAVEGKYNYHRGRGGSTYQNKTSSYSVNEDHSSTDTESWAFSNTTGYNLSKGNSDFWTVESTNSTSVSLEGRILPGQFGVLYRQTTRMALPGNLIAYNRCGIHEVVGDANLYDYVWSVALATGSSCLPLPKSNLPEAECLIAPCNGAQ